MAVKETLRRPRHTLRTIVWIKNRTLRYSELQHYVSRLSTAEANGVVSNIRSLRNSFIHLRTLPSIPNRLRKTSRRIEWSTVSKAADMSSQCIDRALVDYVYYVAHNGCLWKCMDSKPTGWLEGDNGHLFTESRIDDFLDNLG